MNGNQHIAVVGDGIIDIITAGDGVANSHPGGAALNVAKGVAILGRESILVFNSADDDLGDRIREDLSRHRVTPHGLPTTAPTGVARAHFATTDSEPTYTFNDAILDRHYHFTAASGAVIASAAAVALTAFPLDDEASVEGYLAYLERAEGLTAVDPNPRPALLSNLSEFRTGFERVADRSRLTKVSDEDLALLYGTASAPVERLVRKGVVVVVTHGAQGASAYLPGREPIHVPATTMTSPIVDTLGAGDATLAVLISEMAGSPTSTEPEQWRAALQKAMEVAAWTCRSPGGTLRLPPQLTKGTRL